MTKVARLHSKSETPAARCASALEQVDGWYAASAEFFRYIVGHSIPRPIVQKSELETPRPNVYALSCAMREPSMRNAYAGP